MKKYILLSCGLMGFLLSSAQSSQWGFLSNLSLDHISGDGMSNKSQAGYNVGAYAQIQMNRRLGIQPRFLFWQKNIKISSNFKSVFPESATSNFKTGVRMSYISIPVLFNYKINNSWSVNLGPQYSYMLDNDAELLGGNKQAFKREDISIVSGLELKISSLKLYAQYNYGLRNLNAISSGNRQWFSRGLELGIGWRLSR